MHATGRAVIHRDWLSIDAVMAQAGDAGKRLRSPLALRKYVWNVAETVIEDRRPDLGIAHILGLLRGGSLPLGAH